MNFVDMHIHALYGVDDGAKNELEMKQIIHSSYEDGCRIICFTPHYHPGYWGYNQEKVNSIYKKVKSELAEMYPDLEVYIGNELRYQNGCESWLDEKKCHTLNGSNYVLVDFSELESSQNIVRGVERLLNAGYRVVLAHAERYLKIKNYKKVLFDLKSNGVIIQADVQSISGEFGFWVKRRVKKLLDLRLVDVISSDAHNMNSRPPGLSDGYTYVKDKYSEAYADALFYKNAISILRDVEIDGGTIK